MVLTAQQAIDLLIQRSQDYATPEALRDLANQVSTEASGSITLLYSGDIGEVSTVKIIENIVANGTEIRLIDKTEAFTFLSDRRVILAVASAYGVTEEDVNTRGTDANTFLNDGKTGLWADTSKRFADATVGEVHTITPAAHPDRIFAQTDEARCRT